VHPVAAAAARHVRAGRRDTIGGGLEHAAQLALGGPRSSPHLDLDLDPICGGRVRDEDDEPTLELAHAGAPRGEALDPQGLDLLRGLHFIETRCAATCPDSTITEITFVCVPFFRVIRCWPGLTLRWTTGDGPRDLPWSCTSSQYGLHT